MVELIILGAGASVEAGVEASENLVAKLAANATDEFSKDLLQSTILQIKGGEISPEKFLDRLGQLWKAASAGHIQAPAYQIQKIETTYFSSLNFFQNAVTVTNPNSLNYLLPLVRYVAQQKTNRVLVSLNFDNAIEQACQLANLSCNSMPGHGEAGLWYAEKMGLFAMVSRSYVNGTFLDPYEAQENYFKQFAQFETCLNLWQKHNSTYAQACSDVLRPRLWRHLSKVVLSCTTFEWKFIPY